MLGNERILRKSIHGRQSEVKAKDVVEKWRKSYSGLNLFKKSSQKAK